MPDSKLQELFDALKASILKNYGAVPSEIANEFNAIDDFLNTAEGPPAPPETGPAA